LDGHFDIFHNGTPHPVTQKNCVILLRQSAFSTMSPTRTT
jgi:hypothetical protein